MSHFDWIFLKKSTVFPLFTAIWKKWFNTLGKVLKTPLPFCWKWVERVETFKKPLKFAFFLGGKQVESVESSFKALEILWKTKNRENFPGLLLKKYSLLFLFPFLCKKLMNTDYFNLFYRLKKFFHLLMPGFAPQKKIRAVENTAFFSLKRYTVPNQ